MDERESIKNFYICYYSQTTTATTTVDSATAVATAADFSCAESPATTLSATAATTAVPTVTTAAAAMSVYGESVDKRKYLIYLVKICCDIEITGTKMVILEFY